MPKGGKRKGSGRKPRHGVKMIQKTIRLPPAWIDIIKSLGDGKLQRGLEQIIQEWLEEKLENV